MNKILICCLMIASTLAYSQEPKNVVTFPHVSVNRQKQEVRVDAVVSDELGGGTLLEFLLIADKSRAYESFFITDASPEHIQLGLMLAGLKPGVPYFVKREAKKRGKLDLPTPQMVDIIMEWKEGKHVKSARVDKYLFRRKDDKSPAPMPFAYNGSYLYDDSKGGKILAAAASGVIVSLLYQRSAILNCSYLELSPYLGDSQGFSTIGKNMPDYFIKKSKYKHAYDGMIEVHSFQEKPVTLIFRPSKLKSPEYKDEAPKAEITKKETPKTTTVKKETPNVIKVKEVVKIEDKSEEQKTENTQEDPLHDTLLIILGILGVAYAAGSYFKYRSRTGK